MIRGAERLDEYFENRLTDETVPVLGYSVCVFDKSDILYQKQGGRRRLAGDGTDRDLPMTADTRYRIASVSKMFTTLAVMQLWEKGKLDLDREAGEYLGFPLRNPHFPDCPITVRMLLAHTSSMRDGANYIIPFGEDLKEFFLPGGKHYDGGSRFAAPDDGNDPSPGHTFTYCNLAFGVLGTIVEAVSGERFDLYERDHVLRPMGLEAAFNPGLMSQEAFGNLAALYRRLLNGERNIKGEWTALWDRFADGQQPGPDDIYIPSGDLLHPYKDSVASYRIGSNATGFSPQGGLRISTQELSVFGRMILNDGLAPNGTRILSPRAVHEIENPVHIYDPEHPSGAAEDTGRSYGSGFNIISTDIGFDRAHETKNVTLIGHTGSINGLFSACYMNLDEGVGFAYAYNGTGADPDLFPGRFGKRNRLQEGTIELLCDVLF